VSTAEVNGATLHYTERGSGSPLILLHGGLGAGSEWELIGARLAERFRVITPDSRGHGRSSNPAGFLSYSLLADDVAALIVALELGSPTVVGWSDGGQVALELAVRHPGAARALIVGGAFPEFASSGLRDVHRDLLADLDGALGDEADELKALHAHWSALVKQSGDMWLSYGGLADEAVAAIEVPTLVLAADRDELVGLDLAIALYRALPNAEFAVSPSSDHGAPFTPERAPVFAGLIDDFARRHADR
jgi:pimeloyl-ACP methyl ester carboxylesterase